jgi:hypothetical protein
MWKDQIEEKQSGIKKEGWIPPSTMQLSLWCLQT